MIAFVIDFSGPHGETKYCYFETSFFSLSVLFFCSFQLKVELIICNVHVVANSACLEPMILSQPFTSCQPNWKDCKTHSSFPMLQAVGLQLMKTEK